MFKMEVMENYLKCLKIGHLLKKLWYYDYDIIEFYGVFKTPILE